MFPQSFFPVSGLVEAGVEVVEKVVGEMASPHATLQTRPVPVVVPLHVLSLFLVASPEVVRLFLVSFYINHDIIW